MPNPFNMMNGNTNLPQVNGEMRNLINMFKSGGNPMQVIQMLAGRNPQLQPIVQALQNGGNLEQMVRQICRERNINVDEFMKQFR